MTLRRPIRGALAIPFLILAFPFGCSDNDRTGGGDSATGVRAGGRAENDPGRNLPPDTGTTHGSTDNTGSGARDAGMNAGGAGGSGYGTGSDAGGAGNPTGSTNPSSGASGPGGTAR